MIRRWNINGRSSHGAGDVSVVELQSARPTKSGVSSVQVSYYGAQWEADAVVTEF